MPHSWRSSRLQALENELASLCQQMMIWKRQSESSNSDQIRALTAKMDELTFLISRMNYLEKQGLAGNMSSESMIYKGRKSPIVFLTHENTQTSHHQLKTTCCTISSESSCSSQESKCRNDQMTQTSTVSRLQVRPSCLENPYNTECYESGSVLNQLMKKATSMFSTTSPEPLDTSSAKKSKEPVVLEPLRGGSSMVIGEIVETKKDHDNVVSVDDSKLDTLAVTMSSLIVSKTQSEPQKIEDPEINLELQILTNTFENSKSTSSVPKSELLSHYSTASPTLSSINENQSYAIENSKSLSSIPKFELLSHNFPESAAVINDRNLDTFNEPSTSSSKKKYKPSKNLKKAQETYSSDSFELSNKTPKKKLGNKLRIESSDSSLSSNDHIKGYYLKVEESPDSLKLSKPTHPKKRAPSKSISQPNNSPDEFTRRMVLTAITFIILSLGTFIVWYA